MCLPRQFTLGHLFQIKCGSTGASRHRTPFPPPIRWTWPRTPLVEPNEEAAHEQLAGVLIAAELFVVHGGVGKFRARDTRRLLDRANAQPWEPRT
jgi:hypothetical protein